MATLSKTMDAIRAADKAVTVFKVILEPGVQKSSRDASQSTHNAVRETREAWNRHR